MNPITAILIMRGTYILPGMHNNAQLMRYPAHLADGISAGSTCADCTKGVPERREGPAPTGIRPERRAFPIRPECAGWPLRRIA
jgi:hypothetical protein